MIKIINYGSGNSGSIQNMLRYLGHESQVVTDPAELLDAEALILPGVGSFDHAMQKLEPFLPALNQQVVENRIPFLGVCLGMQLLFERSEEGRSRGLGWLPGEVVKFDFSKYQSVRPLAIPHMGWNEVIPVKKTNLFSQSIGEPDRFYFVHSYHVKCQKSEDILAKTSYGYDFTCAVQRGNIIAAQFHPEKSHRFGKQFFKNFLEYVACSKRE